MTTDKNHVQGNSRPLEKPMKHLSRWFVFKRRVRRFNNRLYFHFFRCLFRPVQLKAPLPVEQVKRVLIIRYDVLGDMVATTPVLNALHGAGIKVDVLASPRNISLIEHDRRVDKVILYEPTWKFWFSLPALRRRNYDVIFIFIDALAPRQAIIALLVGTKRTRTVSTFRKSAKHLAFFNRHVRVAGQFHTPIVLRWLTIVQTAIGFKHSILDSPLSLDCERSERITEFLSANKITAGEFIVVNLSSGREATKWRTEKFIALLSQLRPQLPCIFVVMSTAAEAQDAARIEAKLQTPFVVHFPPTNNIFEVIDLLGRSAMVITPDTAIVHLAAAVNKPVVALYTWIGSGHPAEWAPYGVPHRRVVAGDGQAVSEITVAAVASAAIDLWTEIELPKKTNL